MDFIGDFRSANCFAPGFDFTGDIDFNERFLSQSFFVKISKYRVGYADRWKNCIFYDAYPIGTFRFFLGRNISRNHTNVYRSSQSVCHAFAGATRRYIKLYLRIDFSVFLSPDCHHGVERPSTGNGDIPLKRCIFINGRRNRR